jgi:hypothetical protein
VGQGLWGSREEPLAAGRPPTEGWLFAPHWEYASNSADLICELRKLSLLVLWNIHRLRLAAMHSRPVMAAQEATNNNSSKRYIRLMQVSNPCRCLGDVSLLVMDPHARQPGLVTTGILSGA